MNERKTVDLEDGWSHMQVGVCCYLQHAYRVALASQNKRGGGCLDQIYHNVLCSRESPS